MPQLIAENLGKHFIRRLLFRRLSFALEGGSSLAVTGANGSGKSTLLRILAGVLTASAGQTRLHVEGTTVSDEDRPLQAGFVAPYLNVYDGFSAQENLSFIARARRLPNARRRIADVLEQTDLIHRADDPVGNYSSGMKQRIRFAAALLTEPPLLLLDEPSSNLDAEGLDMVRRTVEAHCAARGLLVIATNDAREAAACDSILRIEDYR